MNPHIRSILSSLAQYLFLAFILAYPVAMIMLDILWVGNNIGEHSFTEYSQSLILVLIIATFYYITVKHEDQRPFTYMAIGLFIAMLIREQNSLFNSMGAHLWESLVAATFIMAIYLTRRNKQPFAPVFSAYLRSRAGQIMALGLILLLIYSRFLGMSIIWKSLLESGYVSTIKNAVEEGTELLAYVIILYAAQVYRVQLATKQQPSLEGRANKAENSAPNRRLTPAENL